MYSNGSVQTATALHKSANSATETEELGPELIKTFKHSRNPTSHGSFIGHE